LFLFPVSKSRMKIAFVFLTKRGSMKIAPPFLFLSDSQNRRLFSFFSTFSQYFCLCVWDGRSEKTKIGSMVSAALVSTLVGLAASNIGIIPYEAPAYSIVLEFMLPLTVPLLLFRADLRSVIRSTGTLLLAFLLGSGIVLGAHHKSSSPFF
jgi:uncharacterized membrane protein